MHTPSALTTFLFTDIEGSSRLWEQHPERMGPALERHDAISRAAVEENRGVVVKMLGDGLHAAFSDPLDAIGAALRLQQALDNPDATHGLPLRVRCGLHVGMHQRRDGDFFGNTVNRAARIMSAAHGGQVLVSEATAALIKERMPDGIALRDLGSVRLHDLASPERVYQIVHPQLRQEFPALRSLELIPNNLPQQLTSFIGREHALAEAKKLLQKTRLLTLLGAGGLGKTRLSLQVAADVVDHYPDGVWFVELAAVRDEQLVAQAIASVLNVKEEAGHPVLDALVKFVKDRKLLLILDNCEHLVHGCAEVAKALLLAGPRLTILATSRERLNAAGEVTYPVPALTVPDPQRENKVAALREYEAVHLFVERAMAVQPHFRLSYQNAAAVADICYRLDGIPLALELAAARVRTMSVENIAGRLSDCFRLLTVGDRTALPRQQTLRASIDWSYNLLSEAERTLLRRLAVFAGGWTLEAAESVCAGNGLHEKNILELLMCLVEKSLVIAESEGERYRLLETVRLYAEEQLIQSGEEESVRTRHLAFYLALAEQASEELVGPAQGVWLTRLDLERENILSAHRWCDRAKEGVRPGLRLVFSIKHYCHYRGLLDLGYRMMDEALSRPGAEERTLTRSRVLFGAGQLGCFMGHYGEALRYLDESLSIAREIGDTQRVAAVLQPLGIASLGLGDVTTARRYLEEALALAQELGEKRQFASAMNALAQLHRMESNLDAAEPLYESFLTLARELGDRELIAIGLLNLAMVAIGRGSGGRPREMLREVLAIVDEIGSKPVAQSALEVCAGLAASRKDWGHAALFFGAAEKHMQTTGLRRDPVDETFLTPLISKAKGALGNAFAADETAGRALPSEEVMMRARAWLVRVPGCWNKDPTSQLIHDKRI